MEIHEGVRTFVTVEVVCVAVEVIVLVLVEVIKLVVVEVVVLIEVEVVVLVVVVVLVLVTVEVTATLAGLTLTELSAGKENIYSLLY